VKMGAFEKRFVNGQRHSERVAEQAERRIRTAGFRPGERLLDVGCGNGVATVRLAVTLGLDVVGIDVDAEQIELARAAADGAPGVGFLVADATALPFADGSFDLVYTNKTTHHVARWRDAVAEMARVLGPGGRLVYADFAAPFGSRLPTARGVDRRAGALGLERVSSSRSFLHYSAVLSKPAPAGR